MAKKLKIKPISNPTVMKRGGKEFHVMGFEGSVRDIEKAMKVAAGMQESVELEEAVKFWTVTITKKAGKLFKGQTVDVKASNSAEAIKKGIKQMKGNPALVPSDSVDAVLGESIEEAFLRLPSTVIGTDLFVLQRDLKDFLYGQMKNRDFNPKQFDDMIKRMDKIKKSAKKFNKASDMGPEFKYRG